ncbi:MAG: PAS domain-containing protein [Desulfomonile tiedjei]|nr:PAS domain-containing protein [Desulfomonile tiedjei]
MLVESILAPVARLGIIMAVVRHVKLASGRPGARKRPAERTALNAVIIGGKGILDKASSILDSLSSMNVDLRLTGVVCMRKQDLPERVGTDVDVHLVSNYRKFVREHPPDLVILATRNRRLHQDLLRIVPTKTRILDSFALEALQNLKRVSGQLGTTEKKLHTVEVMKQVLMAGSEVSTMVIDENFRVVDINNIILTKTRMTRKGCLGRACHWVINRSMEPCFRMGGRCPATEVFETGRSTHSVKEERREDGSTRYYTISTYPLPEDEEGRKSVLIVWKDVTTGLARVLDRQARNMRQNFTHVLHQDKMTALGKLAAAAVHDINNPIQGILTFAKLMKEALDTNSISAEQIQRFRTYLELIATESSRCGEILKSLLSFARLGTLQKSAVELNPLLDEILLLIGNRLELQGIVLTRVMPDGVPAVHGDRNQIKQVLLNLMLNSVEAMPEGGVITVSVETGHNSDRVKVTVSDTGTGIPKAVQPQVFEPFVTTKEIGKGVGLGLSVAYGIVAQHGGMLEMQSEEGKGTKFVVTLPAYRMSRQEPGIDRRS